MENEVRALKGSANKLKTQLGKADQDIQDQFGVLVSVSEWVFDIGDRNLIGRFSYVKALKNLVKQQTIGRF